MRFMTIYRPADTAGMEADLPPRQGEIERMGALIEEFAREGVLLATDGLLSSAKGALVRRSGGRFTVVDGPFTEAKELIGGFAILRAESKAHAIELTKRFLSVAGDGEVQVREMYDAPAFVAP